MNAKDIKITPSGNCLKAPKTGTQYISMHDARPTAPNGTVWYVSSVDGDIATLWNFNAWGRYYEEKVNVSFLRPAKEEN